MTSCWVCGTPITRKGQRFCSTKCRVYANRHHVTEPPRNAKAIKGLQVEQVNEVTWKVTDGSKILGWLMNVGWMKGGQHWYARVSDKTYGPTTFHQAQKAALFIIANSSASEFMFDGHVEGKVQIVKNSVAFINGVCC